MVLIASFVFGALSYVPFLASVVFYPKGFLISASGYLNRSPVGDALQIVYYASLLSLGYVLGRRMAFERDYLWIPPCAYFASVGGYIVGLPGLETTTVSGGVFLYETNFLNSTHLLSALFNSASLMGMLFSGICVSFVVRRLPPAIRPPNEEREPTDIGGLAAVAVTATATAFLSYMLPSTFSLISSLVPGHSAAAPGWFYTFQTDSIVIANPLLLFVVLYLLGGEVGTFSNSTKVVGLVFVSVLIGALLGNPIGNYATLYVASGTLAFPNYLANATALATFLAAAVDVAFASSFLGFTAVSLSCMRSAKATDRGRAEGES